MKTELKILKSTIAFVICLSFASLTFAQTALTYQNGFTTFDDGGLAYLPNSGTLAIINQQGGGNNGPTRLDIYSTEGTFLQIISLSTAGLQAGENFLDDGLSDLPNGNLVVLTTFGNVVEVDPTTGLIVAGGYGGFNVLAGINGTPNDISGHAHNADTDNLWVINDQSNTNLFDTITELSPTGAVVSGPFFALPGNLNGDAEAVTFAPNLQSMFIAEDNTNTLEEISLTGQLIQSLSVAALSQGSGLFVDPDGLATDRSGGRIFVMNKGDDTGNIMVFSTGPVAETVSPDQFNTLRGQQVAGTLADVQAADNSYLKYLPGITLSQNEPPVLVEFGGTASATTLSALSMTVETAANTIGLTQTIEFFNFADGVYELVDSRAATLVDSVTEVNAEGDVSRFISGTGEIRGRVGWKANGPTSLFPWTICIDLIQWSATE